MRCLKSRPHPGTAGPRRPVRTPGRKSPNRNRFAVYGRPADGRVRAFRTPPSGGDHVSVRSSHRSAVALVAATALAAFGLAACGNSSGGSGSSPSSSGSASSAPIVKDDTLAALLPASVVSDGLKVGTDTTYPPNEYIDGGKIVGMDIDLTNAVAQVLGVKATFTSSPFDAILPGVQSGKYNLGVSSFTANADRQKVVNFATYLNAGTQWAVKKGNPDGIDLDNACGKKVAVQKGTVQVDDLQKRSKA